MLGVNDSVERMLCESMAESASSSGESSASRATSASMSLWAPVSAGVGLGEDCRAAVVAVVAASTAAEAAEVSAAWGVDVELFWLVIGTLVMKQTRILCGPVPKVCSNGGRVEGCGGGSNRELGTVR